MRYVVLPLFSIHYEQGLAVGGEVYGLAVAQYIMPEESHAPDLFCFVIFDKVFVPIDRALRLFLPL